MSNYTSLNALKSLYANRFALREYSDMPSLRAWLASKHSPPLAEGLWLIGTDGCHLCELALCTAEQAYRTTANASPMMVDVLDFADEVRDLLAPMIPVLVGTSGVLCYPFSLPDVVSLLDHSPSTPSP